MAVIPSFARIATCGAARLQVKRGKGTDRTGARGEGCGRRDETGRQVRKPLPLAPLYPIGLMRQTRAQKRPYVLQAIRPEGIGSIHHGEQVEPALSKFREGFWSPGELADECMGAP